MQLPSSENLAKLVQPGRVHRKLYSDPAIFEPEIAHLGVA
jgi:hypothetical protein